MPNTSGLTFAPTLHQITSERVAFIFNTNVSGSQEVAEYYRDKRELPNNNLIGLSVTSPSPGSTGLSCESLLTKFEYLNQIENPLLSALENLGTDFTSDNSRSIWVLILGFGIPLAYDDDGEIIAIASKLHKLGQENTHKQLNHTYDRRGEFKFFDDLDADKLFITAVIDGPTKASAKKLIDRASDVDNQTFIAGKIYVDPYGNKITSDDLDFQTDIINFIDNEIPNLGLESVITTDVEDPYAEPTVLSLDNESFYWGWFNPTYAQQLFKNQNERRVFLYNADDRAACNIHFYDFSRSSPFDENGSDHWCNLAINVEPGYATCSGSVDNPGSNAFLRPRPFFEALHQGSTIGEAFLFSSKFVNWKTILIGDPLVVVNFPVDLPSSQDVNFTLLSNNEVIRQTKESIEESLGWAYRQTKLLDDIRNKVVSSSSISEEIRLLEPSFSWLQSKNEASQQNIFFQIVSAWENYIQQTTSLTLSNWLVNNEIKVSEPLNKIINQTGVEKIPDSLIYPEGFWDWTFRYVHPVLSLDSVFFELQVFSDSTFTYPVFELNTITNVNGWEYESEPDIFVRMPDDGFPSNFSGRRIKFSAQSSHFLTRSEIYYLKWQAIDINNVKFNKQDTRKIVIYT